MSKTLRVLNIKVSKDDDSLLHRYLAHTGYELVFDRVDTLAAMRTALETQEWDVILADYAMPQFGALEALAILKEMELDIPFIVISSTVVEKLAVKAMMAGAHDYIIKDNLVRLAPAIERELQAAESRRAQRRAEEALKASVTELHTLFAAMTDVILVLDAQGRYLKILPTDPAYLYKPSADLIGKTLDEVFPKEEADFFLEHIRRALYELRMHRVEYRLQIGGTEVWFEGSVSPMSKDSVVWIARDITERKWAEQRLALQCDVARALSESATLTEAVPKVLQAICEKLEWEMGEFWIVDRDSNILRRVALWHKPPVETAEVEAVYQQGTFLPSIRLPEYIWERGRPIWIADIVKDANPIQEPIAAPEGLHAALGYPVLLGSEIIGIIDLFSCETKQPDEDVLKLMAAISSQIGQFDESKRAEEKIKQRNRQLAALNVIAASVSASLELSEMLATLKRLLAEQMENISGGIWLYDKADDIFHLQTAWGLPEEMLAELKTFPAAGFYDGQLTPQPDAIFSLEFSKHAPALVSDSRVDQPEWKSYLRLPLVAKGEIQGIVALLSQEPILWGEEQISFFKALGQQVGIGIHNARLFVQVRESRDRLQTLSLLLVEVQEAERRHIARELHDQMGQILTGLVLTLESCKRLPIDKARESLSGAQALANELIKQARDLSLVLRPAMLDNLGLLPALLWHFDRYTSQTNIRVIFEHNGLDRRFQPEVETSAYRIVQEALTNVARYADVSEVTAHIWANPITLCIQIEDHGVGFVPETALANCISSGLAGMRERVISLSGNLSIESAPGAGTRLTAELPLRESIEMEKGADECNYNIDS